MGSWVLHAAGLLIEELSRAQVQVLGRGCRPLSAKVNANSPPPDAVRDRHGHWWEVGDRARHIDSTSRGDHEKDGFSAGERSRAPGKYKLGKVPCAEGGDRILLLPDHVEVRGQVDEPTAVCASDGPPGLPLSGKNSQQNALPTSAMPRRGTIRAPVRSVDPKLAHAHHAVAQRRLRSYQSEHFCLMVPCCRVTLGPSTHDQLPATSPTQWPAYVSALVLGAYVDGEIMPRGRPAHAGMTGAAAKMAAHRSSVKAASGQDDDRVKWQTDSGETVLLDFHNGPASRGPAGGDGDIYNLLTYLDEHWAKKARRFPATWSLLWVETMDTEMVLAEMRGEGVEDQCPVCTAPLIFGCLHDKDPTKKDESDEESDGQCSSKSKSSVSELSTPSSLAEETAIQEDGDYLPGRPVAESKAQKQRRATRVVQKMLRESTLGTLKANNVSRPTLAHSAQRPLTRDNSTCSLLSDDFSRGVMSPGMTSTRVSTAIGETTPDMSRWGSLAQPSMMKSESIADVKLPADLVADRILELKGETSRASALIEGDKSHCDIAAWEAGSLPCSRCHTMTEPACHALICPRLDVRHSYFLPICAECREAYEHVFLQRRWQAARMGNSEDWLRHGSDSAGKHALLPEVSEEQLMALRKGPAHAHTAASGAINSSAVLPFPNELCVAIELEMHLCIEDVDHSRQANLLHELRDELHRVLMVPLCQIFVLQDDSSRKGIFQIGILHPDLVPTPEELREKRLLAEHRKSRKKSRKSEKSEGLPAADTHGKTVIEDVAAKNIESASISTELGKMWDRLVTIYHGDSGEYRFFCTNAFPLLRLKKRDGTGLQWRSGIIVSSSARRELVQKMHDSKEAGSDDEGSIEDSDMDDLLDLEQESSSSKHAEPRRPSTVGARKMSSSGTTAEGTNSTARRPSCGRFMKTGLDGLTVHSNLSDQVSPPGSASPATARSGTGASRGWQEGQMALDDREVESQLRPTRLQMRCFGAFQHVQTKAESAKAEDSLLQQAERDWARKAEHLGLIPPRSELSQVHMKFLHHLAWEGNLGNLKLALETASSSAVNAGDRCGRTPLHLATARCKAEVVAEFVSAAEPTGPVKLEPMDIKGRTPLHYSAYRGDDSVVSHFVGILQGKSLDVAELSTGDTSVLIAARSQHHDVLKSLLFAFASPNIANRRGLTALHVAAAAGSTHCTQLLLRAGAELEPQDSLDRTPWQWASIYKYADVMALLVDAGSAAGQDPWSSPTPSGSISIPKPSKGNSRKPRGQRAPSNVLESPKSRRPRPQSVATSPRAASTRTATSPTSEVPALPLVANTPRTPRAQTAPATPAGATQRMGSQGSSAHGTRSSLRDALLEGVAPADKVTAVSPGGWAGNVGSLAVRWRSWAHAAFAQAEGSGLSAQTLQASNSELDMAEPTREEVSRTCQALGGFFCTVCWEYVLERHPCGHLTFERSHQLS